MHKTTVEAPGLTIGSGEIVGLSTDQLFDRAHRVEVLDDKPSKLTRVRVIEPIQFKAGEVVHLDRAPKDGSGTAPAAKPPAKPKTEKRDVNRDTPEMAQLRSQFDASWAQLKREAGEARAEGVKAGRAEMLAEVQARNDLFEAADDAADAVAEATAALDAEKDPAKQEQLQKALDAAVAAQAEADKAVADLPELKA